MRRNLWIAWITGVLCVSISMNLWASPTAVLLGGANGPSGFSANLFSRGPNSAYFNPSRLVWSHQALELGFFVLTGDLKIDLRDRPEGVDILSSIYNVRVEEEDGSLSRLDDRPLPTELLRAREDTHKQPLQSYVTLGMARHLIPGRLVFGVFAMLPTDKIQGQRAFFADEREQYFSNGLDFELVGDRLELATLSFGFGALIRDWLALGVGLSMELSTASVTQVYMPDSADQGTVLLNSNIEAKSVFIPHVGVTIRPSDSIEIAGTFHAPWNADFDGRNEVTLWNYEYPEDQDYILQEFRLVNGYQPMSASLGLSYALDGSAARRWHVGAFTKWSRWSQYRDRHGERPSDSWSDTFGFGLGIHRKSELSDFNLSVRYEPTPVPYQDGRTNYVDNDRMGISLGWRKTVQAWGQPVSIGVSAQFQLLVPKTVEKSMDSEFPIVDEYPDNVVDVFTGEKISDGVGFQTNNPGYPGYSSKGWLLGAGVNAYMPF